MTHLKPEKMSKFTKLQCSSNFFMQMTNVHVIIVKTKCQVDPSKAVVRVDCMVCVCTIIAQA